MRVETKAKLLADLNEQQRQRNIQQQNNDLMTILSTVEGRRFMTDLFLRCKLYQDTYTGTARDNYFAGQRSIAMSYLQQLDGMPDEAFDLVEIGRKEYRDAQREAQAELERRYRGDNEDEQTP